MRFYGGNYHKSSGLEKFASNLSAIDYILFFRGKHRRVFNAIVVLIAVFVFLIVIILSVPSLVNSIFQVTNDSLIASSENYEIYQPTPVDIENLIEHNREEDGSFSSTVRYAFDTSYLLNEGKVAGSAHQILLSTMYRNKVGDVCTTNREPFTIIVGDRVSFASVINDPTGFISVDDILGFNIE